MEESVGIRELPSCPGTGESNPCPHNGKGQFSIFGKFRCGDCFLALKKNAKKVVEG